MGALLSAANTIQNQKDDQIEMSVLNPTMVQDMNPEERGKYEKKMMEQAEAHKHATEQNKLIMEEHRKLKNLMAAQKNLGKTHIGKKKRGVRGKKKKTQFEARLKDDVSVDGIGAKLKLSSNIAKNPLLEDAGAVMTAADTTKQTNSGKPRLHKKSRSFRAHKTAEGKVYYSDTDTNET